MRRIYELFLVATLMLGLSGCGAAVKGALGDIPAVPDDIELTGDLAKDRDALMSQNRDLQARLASNRARIKQLDADIESERIQSSKTRLLILSGMLVIAAIVCIGLIVAFPNPAFSRLKWLGAATFGSLAVGCWFLAFILPYWHWIALGVALLLLGMLMWWVLIGRRSIKGTQLAADYADKLEERVRAFVPPEHLAALDDSIRTLKTAERDRQSVAGVWGFIEHARVALDKSSSKAT